MAARIGTKGRRIIIEAKCRALGGLAIDHHSEVHRLVEREEREEREMETIWVRQDLLLKQETNLSS
jgi:hypothetical protein